MSDSSAEEQAVYDVAATDEIDDGEVSVIEVDDDQVALFSVDGEYYATSNVCPHQGGPLGQGRVEDECVYCPWHGWQFDIKTGEHVQGGDAVPTYDVSVEGDRIHIRK